MRKNIVYNVASAFDLETEECFKISGYDGFFYFAVDCLRQATNTGDEEADAILAKIVMGDVDVIKFPWKPKLGEPYWTFDYDPRSDSPVLRVRMDDSWGGTFFEQALLKAGWVFGSKKAAENALPTVAAGLNMEYFEEGNYYHD